MSLKKKLTGMYTKEYFNPTLILIGHHALCANISTACMFESCLPGTVTQANKVNKEKLWMSHVFFAPCRDDCSLFDGLMEEDEKDKAKR